MSRDKFSTTRQKRYLEDYLEGKMYEFGPITITAEEIIQFGQKYDPQAFYTNPQAAK